MAPSKSTRPPPKNTINNYFAKVGQSSQSSSTTSHPSSSPLKPIPKRMKDLDTDPVPRAKSVGSKPANGGLSTLSSSSKRQPPNVIVLSGSDRDSPPATTRPSVSPSATKNAHPSSKVSNAINVSSSIGAPGASLSELTPSTNSPSATLFRQKAKVVDLTSLPDEHPTSPNEETPVGFTGSTASITSLITTPASDCPSIASSLSSKRAAADTLESPVPSKKVKANNSTTQHTTITMDDDEIIPSSEADDEMDIMPLDRSFTTVASCSDSQPDAALSRRVSATSSEAFVEMQLDDLSSTADDYIDPITPRKPPSARLIAKARRSLETSSPLTPLPSPKRVTRSSRGNSRIPLGHEVIVEIPSLPKHITSQYRMSAPPSPKRVVLPKSKGTAALDALLAEKKKNDARAKKTVSHPEETLSPVLTNGGSRATTAVVPEPMTPTSAAALLADELVDEKQADRLQQLVAETQGNDASRKQMEEERMINQRCTFWNAVEPTVNPSVPALPDMDVSDPIMKALATAVATGAPSVLSIALQTVGLAARTIPDEAVDWLLNIAVLHTDHRAGQAALASICRLLHTEAGPLSEIDLDFGTVRRLLVGLGANDQTLSLLAPPDDHAPCAWTGPAFHADRQDQISRFLGLLAAFSSSNHICVDDIDQTILSLLLLSQDPDLSFDLRDEVARVIHLTLKNLDRVKPKKADKLELRICSTILNVYQRRTAQETLCLLPVLSQCDVRSVRLSRWIALSVLAPKAVKLNQDKYMGIPSLPFITSLVLSGQLERDDPRSMCEAFRIDGLTDYNQLRNYVDLLSFVLTDIASYREDRDCKDNMVKLVQAFDGVTSKISDKSGDALLLTLLKGDILRLKLRISYQATKSGTLMMHDLLGEERKVQANIKSFFGPSGAAK